VPSFDTEGVFRKLCQSKFFELVGSQNSFFVG
jgi:hypothetical protein